MAQVYPNILGTDAVADSRQMLIDRDNTLKTDFAGTEFPEVTSPDDIGTVCYRIDLEDAFRYKGDDDNGQPIWTREVPTENIKSQIQTLTEETFYIDLLNGEKCDSVISMWVNVDGMWLNSDTYTLTNGGTRVLFNTSIEANSVVELRWLYRVKIARDGATFVPSVSEDGVISWDNDQNLPNPNPVAVSVTHLAVGTTFSTANTSTPGGALLLDGTEYNIRDYQDFYDNWIATGKVPSGSYADWQTVYNNNNQEVGFFAVDTNAGTFKMPVAKPYYVATTQYRVFMQIFNGPADNSLIDLQSILNECIEIRDDVIAEGAKQIKAITDHTAIKIQEVDDEGAKQIEKARIWATGEDAEVDTVAPGEEEHSSRGYADLSMALANEAEDVPIDTSSLLALDVIRGPQGPVGPQGIQGERGDVGYHYTPSVSAQGDLSWTNDGNLENPETVNIKGPKGDVGPQGENANGILIYDPTYTYNLNELVVVSGEEVKMYKSLADNNTGNSLTDKDFWEEVSLGGGGLEIGDIGIAPLGIDENQNKRRYLNGQLISQTQFVSFANKLKEAVEVNPNLATTEENWQAEVTNSPFGICDKFVIDDTAGTIRLPKYPEWGLRDLLLSENAPVVGNGNALGINFGTTDYTMTSRSLSGMRAVGFGNGTPPQAVGTTVAILDGSTNSAVGISTDATKSGLIADLTNASEEAKIQGKWFIQVATGVEESVDVTREIELNNPFSLFDVKWSDHILDNLSWIRSDTFEWQDGNNVYQSAYNELEAEYTNTESTNQVDGYDTQFTVNGDVSINNELWASNFSTSNYIIPSLSFFAGNQDWSFEVLFNTGSDIQSIQNILSTNVPYQHIGVTLEAGKIRFESWFNNTTTKLFTLETGAIFEANGYYKIKCGYTVSTQTYYLYVWNDNTQEWMLANSVANIGNISSPSGNFLLGVDWGATQSQAPFLGKINLTNTKFSVNNQVVWSPYKNVVKYRKTPKGYKIAGGSQSANIQSLYDDKGIAWYYIIDGTNKKFKLPRSKFAFVGVRNGVGNFVDESLPNIKGNLKFTQSTDRVADGCFERATEYENTTKGGGDISGIPTLFNASLSSSTYQDGAPVQQRSTEMYLYFYVGETIQGANLINMESTLLDIADLKKSTLKTNQITNCITEIPQDIKYTLVDSIFTLKAGSKIYVPNGFEEDGTTRKFDEVVLNNDAIIEGEGAMWGEATEMIVFVKADGSSLRYVSTARDSSGPTAPSETNNRMWFDTTSNLIKHYNLGADTGNRYSFPIVIGKKTDAVMSTKLATVDQVFNGFGYIGNTVFALPGVKGLVPNGRNPDGTLKNIEYTINNVIVNNSLDLNRFDLIYVDVIDGTLGRWGSNGGNVNYVNKLPAGNIAPVKYCKWYEEYSNLWWASGDTTQFSSNVYMLPLFMVKTDTNGAVEKFIKANTASHFVNYSDTAWVAHQAMPSSVYYNMTLGNSGSQYQAQDDGYFVVECFIKATGWIQMFGPSITARTSNPHTTNGADFSLILPVSKGQTITVQYSNCEWTQNWHYFRFIFANGSVG